MRLRGLDRPSDVAERLPKALIHRNVPGEPVHAFLGALDDAWDREAALAGFGVRQRFLATVQRGCAADGLAGAGRPGPLAAGRGRGGLGRRRARGRRAGQ